MSVQGAVLVARQEFRIRLRTGRWRRLLLVWVLVFGLFTLLADASMANSGKNDYGATLFAILMFLVLGLVLIVTPSLTAQSINGDRERGTLATLQVTRLRPVEIAVGKLLAGWAVGLAALALTVPFLAWAMVRGGVGVWRVPVVYLVTALLIGVVCAVSLALSSLVARGITSSMLAYVVVFALTLGTLLAYSMVGAVLSEEHTATTPEGFSYVETRSRSDLVWWLLAPNPFVIVIDATPKTPPRPFVDDDHVLISDDPLWAIGESIRQSRLGPDDERPDVRADELAPVWPYGLAFDLLLGAAALWVTTRRLRTPVASLPAGVRIA